jgi:glucokinase
MAAMKEVFVGIDIGGTNTVIGVFDEHLKAIGQSRFPTMSEFPNRTDNPESYLDELAKQVRSLLAAYAPVSRLAAAGMGVPGQVDGARGMVYDATNLGWDHVPLAELVQQRLGCPVFIEHDVRTITLGEALAGAAKGRKDVICVTLGTGVAAGIMVNGALVAGSDFCAGEIGHDDVQGLEYVCNCGKVGCLETIASAPGVVRLAREAVRSGSSSGETPLNESPEGITAHSVYLAAIHGDEVAAGIFRKIAEALGQKLSTAVALLNPEIIIIGGGLANAGSVLLTPLSDYLFSKYPAYRGKLEIVRSELGDAAGLIGAAHHAAKRIGRI